MKQLDVLLDDDGVMLCPVCKCNYLHLLGMRQVDADSHPGETAQLTYICEFKHHVLNLMLEQRKGETLMYWELQYESSER